MPSIMAIPRIMRFRATRMSIRLMFDNAIEMIIPSPTRISDPITGSGMMARTAPTLPNRPHTINKTPATCHVKRAAIYNSHIKWVDGINTSSLVLQDLITKKIKEMFKKRELRMSLEKTEVRDRGFEQHDGEREMALEKARGSFVYLGGMVTADGEVSVVGYKWERMDG